MVKAAFINVLSIDAWRNPEGWDWNSWSRVDTIDADVIEGKSTRQILRMMREIGLLGEGSKGRVALDDDQYNLVIVDRKTREPIFAIAYGEKVGEDGQPYLCHTQGCYLAVDPSNGNCDVHGLPKED